MVGDSLRQKPIRRFPLGAGAVLVGRQPNVDLELVLEKLLEGGVRKVEYVTDASGPGDEVLDERNLVMFEGGHATLELR